MVSRSDIKGAVSLKLDNPFHLVLNLLFMIRIIDRREFSRQVVVGLRGFSSAITLAFREGTIL
ncbi:MAG: hypothetical protein AUJ07_05670 [Crenarchaeota archaeon 13_1_40CM_3_53_5]|nr:MAG: hypothetical protein AUJ07_05670 [Crenarchaeota archaeon 13_1_40CM_3_53_5]